MSLFEAYTKKTVSYSDSLSGKNFRFTVSQELFSSQSVDLVTQRLLRALSYAKVSGYRKILYLGCGYGPLGIVLQQREPDSEVHFVDRDALALEFTRMNAQLNAVQQKKEYACLGYDGISESDFDLIVSNIPAKVGPEVLRHMLLDGRYCMQENGTVAVVVIEPIAAFCREVLQADDSVDLFFERTWPGHTVFIYRFVGQSKATEYISAQERGLFARGKYPLRFRGKEFQMDVSHDIAEFSQLSFDTRLILQALPKLPQQKKQAVFLFPGLGHLAVAAASFLRPDSTTLIDRDLLALQTTKANLVRSGIPQEKIVSLHQADFSVPLAQEVDLIFGVLPEKTSVEVLSLWKDQIERQLVAGGTAVFASSSTAITRWLDELSRTHGFRILDREKNKGRSRLIVQKKK